MAVTGRQIRERTARHRRALAQLGQATGGSTTTVVDTLRLRGDTLSADQFGGEAWLRLTTGAAQGFTGKVDRLDPTTGTLYFSPAAGAAVAAGDRYEVWLGGLLPDAYDAARDIALTQKCKDWRLRPLSLLAYVEDWPATAYDATAGGVSGATAQAVALDFPQQYQTKAMRVTASAANGFVSSEALGVQPGQAWRLFGLVRASAGTGSLRVRNLTAGADVPLTGVSTFSLLGWQYLDVLFVVPAGCAKVQVWAGGVEATFVGDFAGLGLVPLAATSFTLPVTGTDEVGRVFVRTGPRLGTVPWSADDPALVEVAAWRKKGGQKVRLEFPAPPAAGGVYVELAHHYPALQSDYLTVADRTAGDAATTECPLEYVEAATVVELLAGSEAFQTEFRKAVAELAAVEARLGPEPSVIAEPGRRPPYRRVQL